jgi:hypothetical protein
MAAPDPRIAEMLALLAMYPGQCEVGFNGCLLRALRPLVTDANSRGRAAHRSTPGAKSEPQNICSCRSASLIATASNYSLKISEEFAAAAARLEAGEAEDGAALLLGRACAGAVHLWWAGD